MRDKRNVVNFRLAIRGVGGPDRLPDSLSRLVAKNAAREDFASAPTSIAGFTNDLQTMRMSAVEAEPYIEEFFAVSRSRPKLFEQFGRKLAEFRGKEEIRWRLADPGKRRYQPMTAEGKVLKALRAALTTAKDVLAKQEAIHDMDEYFQVVNQIRTTLRQIERLSRAKNKGELRYGRTS